MLCFWTREYGISSTSPLATQRASSPLYSSMANEGEKNEHFGVPTGMPESIDHEVHSRSRSASLEISRGNDVEKIGTASVEKLNSTGNSSEKNSIASEKIADPSNGAIDATGERERFQNLSDQQHNEHSNPLREDIQPPEETGQQPSRRLSPVSGIFTSQQREGAAGTSGDKGAVPPISEHKNTEKVAESEAFPALGRNPRREFSLRRALSRRLRSKPQHFTRLPGAVKGMKGALSEWCTLLCEQALTLSIIFGLLSVLLMVAAVTSSSWRTHKFTYEDVNGINIVTVHAGLNAVQRIHKLSKHNDTATLYLVDAARSFKELIDSPYCLEDEKEVDKDYERWRTWVDKESPPVEKTPSTPPQSHVSHPARRLSDTDVDATSASRAVDAAEDKAATPAAEDHTFETEQEKKTGTNLPTEPGSDADLPQFEGEDATAAEEDTDEKGSAKTFPRKEEGLAPFELVFGRDPAAAGKMTPAASKLRRALLGPVIFELNCRYLPKLKLAGDALWSLIFPALVLSGAALMASWLGSKWIRSLFGRRAYPTAVLLCISAAFWLLVVILTVAGLSSWGAISDVAACVSDTGGASVCVLGPSSTLAVASLALQVLAALSCGFCIAAVRDAPKNRIHRDVRITTGASSTNDQQEHDEFPCHHNRRGPRCLGRHPERLKDVAIEVQDNDRLPSGEQTPPTVAGQEQGSRHLTTTESQSEAGAGDTRRDACNSRLRSRELVETEACVADQK